MIDSMALYHNNYLRRHDPATDIQKVALRGLESTTGVYLQLDTDQLTFGEAVESIQYLYTLLYY
jgi:hypothetical protein